MKNRPQVRSGRMDIKDPEIRKMVRDVVKLDPLSRTMTQAIRNAVAAYLKQLEAEAQS